MSEPVGTDDEVYDAVAARAVERIQEHWIQYVASLQALEDELTIASLVPSLATLSARAEATILPDLERFHEIAQAGATRRLERQEFIDAMQALADLTRNQLRLIDELRAAREAATKGSA